MDAFIIAFVGLGYVECDNGDFEEGFEKVALYGKDSGSAVVPTHMAKQIPDGRWKSKLGRLEDIEHKELSNVDGDNYGSARRYMKRSVAVKKKAEETTDMNDADPGAGEVSPPIGAENPNAREDFTFLVNAAARKQKPDE